MQAATKERLQELQVIISKMPLEVCCVAVLPEFGVRWREVSRAVRNCRLPMVPASVARVLCRHVAKSLPDEDVADIVARLRLKLIATQERKWFVIDLLEPTDEEISVAHLIRALPGRVAQALTKTRAGRTMRPEVQTVLLGDLLYMSVQLVSDTKQGGVLYVATPPGQPVALVSCTTSGLLKASVEGLGFRKHEDAQLFGRDVKSLLRIHNQNHSEDVNHLAGTPEYNPIPVVTATGIDYTNKTYDEHYVDNLLGPNPPLLTDLIISCNKPFFDASRLDKKINLTVQLRSEDVSKTLKAWVSKNAIAPTSDFFQIFHKIKSNKITFQDGDESND
ncbi:uncharacterized protein LOC126379552 [Pectinophora gossypiella]|uniref:uncharacterized protein LOC126379552 n=1 Tax=Pectinophora gossypiella TaxID=13191 RepID=UPI00214E90FB|nr:uncharacterized protein LOC126379552 [Pectinophora gossypiella]